ncbi:MAG: hypothetical protein NT106_07815 [Candidatus Sumerlaeota bacterium]|nr:hypothetical protein [Candidatus Sumerlaeota bacterium]
MRKVIQYALIGLLSIIAVAAITPNFMEAQIRQRTARARANLATLASALETYQVDYNKYPGDGAQYCWNYMNYPYTGYWFPPDTLTTPIAYISADSMRDPFREDALFPVGNKYKCLRYVYVDMTWGTAGTRLFPSTYYPFLKSWYGSWNITSVGPDTLFGPYYPNGSYPGNLYPQLQVPYDPTNGLGSNGDLMLSQRKPPDIP